MRKDLKVKLWYPNQKMMSVPLNIWNLPDWDELKDKPIVLLYAGLTDEQGKEICEGDILRIKPNSEDIFDVEVIFYNGSFCYKHNGAYFPFYAINEYNCITDNKEVIGNIYENQNY